jgi:hypothetical protein
MKKPPIKNPCKRDMPSEPNGICGRKVEFGVAPSNANNNGPMQITCCKAHLVKTIQAFPTDHVVVLKIQ